MPVLGQLSDGRENPNSSRKTGSAGYEHGTASVRSVSWRRRRSPAGRRPVCARRCSRRRPRSSVPRSCATSPRTSRSLRAPRRSMAASPMHQPVTRRGSPAISPRAPAWCWPTARRRCLPTSRASAAACCMRRRRLFASGFGAVCLVNSDSPTLPTALLIRAARALVGARRAGRAWPGGRRRLLPVGHEAAARASVRRHRLEHEQRRRRDAARGRRRLASRWSRCPPGTTSMMPPRWPDLLQRLRAERHSRTCSLTPRRPPRHASNASGCAAALEHRRAMTDPMRRLAMLAAIGALLVCLVAVGLAVLDWQPSASTTAPPRWRVRRQHLRSPACCGCSPSPSSAEAGCRPGRSGWCIVVAVAMRLLTLAGAAGAVVGCVSLRVGWPGATGGHQPVSLSARRTGTCVPARRCGVSAHQSRRLCASRSIRRRRR